MIKTSLLLLLLSLSQLVARSKDPIVSILEQRLPNYSGFSVYAIEAESGKVLCQSAQKSLTPASIQKLITTSAALELLGPDYCFETTLSYTGSINQQNKTLKGDLILKGGCDPVFYSSHSGKHYQNTFTDWGNEIKSLNINKIEGNLILDLSALNQNTTPGGWIWEDIGNYYGAAPSALSFADNLYKIHFQSPNEVNQPVTIQYIEPEIKNLTLINSVLSSDIQSDLAIVYGAPGSLQQLIDGTIPKGRSNFTVKAAMPDPPVAAARKLIESLSSQKIILTGDIIKGVTQSSDPAITIIAIKKSPPLSEIIVPLNKESINLIAEHLLLELGRKSNNTPTLESGIQSVNEFINKHGIFSEGFFPKDGSGLSRSGATTARTIVETLKYIYDSQNREAFLNSLPLAGSEGTLKYLFKGSTLENNVRAKTGSMERVRSIAGFMNTDKGKTVIFALIINNFNSSNGNINTIIEAVLTKLFHQSLLPSSDAKP